MVWVMIYTTPEICWCGESHIDKCDIHGHQEYYHDEAGDGTWYIYNCNQCEAHMSSWADEAPESYHQTQHLRAMEVLASVFYERLKETGLAHP